MQFNTAIVRLRSLLTLRTTFIVTAILAATLTACDSNRRLGTENDPAQSRIVKRVAGGPIATSAAFDAARLANADFGRGGLLYDNWYTATQKPAPTSTHAIWALTTNISVRGADTWRCSSCHGWDYKGSNGAFGDPFNTFATGIHGILPALHQLTDASVWSFLRDGTVTSTQTGQVVGHNFITQLNETDLYDLTKFIMTVRQEAVSSANPLTTAANVTRVKGSQTDGARLFNANATGDCVSCHGATGNAIAGVNVVAAAAADPARVVHRVRFGIASTPVPMPGTLATTGGNIPVSLKIAGDVTTFAGHGGPSDHIRGGRMYDDWTTESGTDPATVPDNPLWKFSSVPPADRPIGIESWHCADCHGWDYEGGMGFANNNLVELKEVRGWTPGTPGNFQFVFDKIMDGFPMYDPVTKTVIEVHNYRRFLAAAGAPGLQEQDVWDLVDFTIEETLDTHRFLQPDTGTAVGGLGRIADAVIGKVLFDGPGPKLGADAYSCAECHGLTGKDTVNGIALDLPLLSWTDPWRFFHRTRFGTPRAPGSTLPSPLGPTATFMPGLLEATEANGTTPTDNDDGMHVMRYIQVDLNGGVAAAGIVSKQTASQRITNKQFPNSR